MIIITRLNITEYEAYWLMDFLLINNWVLLEIFLVITILIKKAK